VLVHYNPGVDMDEYIQARGKRFKATPNTRGYRATALVNLRVGCQGRGFRGPDAPR
jgi:hypothetical protein